MDNDGQPLVDGQQAVGTEPDDPLRPTMDTGTNACPHAHPDPASVIRFGPRERVQRDISPTIRAMRVDQEPGEEELDTIFFTYSSRLPSAGGLAAASTGGTGPSGSAGFS
jgi:hypothetical protein